MILKHNIIKMVVKTSAATSLLLIPVFLFNNCCLVLLPAYNGKEKKKATKGFGEPKVMLIIETFLEAVI